MSPMTTLERLATRLADLILDSAALHVGLTISLVFVAGVLPLLAKDAVAIGLSAALLLVAFFLNSAGGDEHAG